jgi:aspartyl protease family protein
MKEIPGSVKHLTIWLLIGTAIFLAMQAWQAQHRRALFQVAGGGIELRRGPDGHFHWPGRLNGIAVEFLVDTGATSTALPRALAEQAGLKPEGRMQSNTAGGVVEGYMARADVQLAGGVGAQRLPVAVLPDLASPLLGMDLLGKLRFSQQGGVLRLEPAAR